MKTKYNSIRVGRYRSKLEYNVAKVLEESGIPFIYECEKITLIENFEPKNIRTDKKLRKVSYTPDFCLEDCYIEVKGYFTADFKLKMRLIDKVINKPLYVVRNIKQLREVIRSIKENKHISS